MMRIPRKAGLLLGCALGAMLASHPARAQSFNGTPTVVTGSASVFTGPGNTSVFITTAETVINWSTVDTGGTGAISFQPAGTTAVFSSDPSLADYTVLNRILPVDTFNNPTNATVAFNGTVLALLGNNPGGNIWFYSPTGIIAGPTAVFNVGSLILTTNDIAFVPNPPGGFGSIYGPGGLVQFSGPAGSTGFVDVQPGAQINATGVNAYVALVAPRVVQGGTVTVDGQAAYIAAEQVDMHIDAGLFDFTLLVGTTDSNGIVHTGETTGPTPADALDTQIIRMVALPKNDALTMLLSGSIGYQPAGSVSGGPGYIELTAGFPVSNPLLNAPADPSNRLGNISISNATFRNTVDAYASGNITLAPTGGTIFFDQTSQLTALGDISMIAGSGEQILANADLNLFAGERGAGGTITIEAQEGGLIDIARALQANAGSRAFYGDALGNATGGTINVTANGGTIHALEAFLWAPVTAGTSATDSFTAIGGTIAVSTVNGGAIAIDNFISLNATAFGGFSNSDATGGSITLDATGGTIATAEIFGEAGALGGFADTQGGRGQGGVIDLSVAAGGTIAATNLLSLSTTSSGGDSQGQGGDGIGGSVSVTDNGGTLDFSSVFLNAGGAGGSADNTAGDGLGGTVFVGINQQAQLWDELVIDASSSAGTPATEMGMSGSASGSASAVTLSIAGPGSLEITGNLAMTSNAFMDVNGPVGFSGTAGNLLLEVEGGGVLTVGGTMIAEASALMRSDTFGTVPNSTPIQTGGNVTITADGGQISAGALDVRAEAEGYFAQVAAGSVTGGEITVSSLDGGSIVIGNGTIPPRALLSANAYGAPGPAPAHATGGVARIVVRDAEFTASGNLELSASGAVRELADTPPPGPGFSATGGTATIELLRGSLGTAAFSAGDVALSAVGDAGLNISLFSGEGVPPAMEPRLIQGNGGTGTGGIAGLTMQGGSLLLNDLAIDASGTGGASGISPSTVPFRSGEGFGGSSTIDLADGEFSLGAVSIGATGTGGASGGVGGAEGGHGHGGAARFALIDSAAGPAGARGLGSLLIDASGVGGSSSTGGVDLTVSVRDPASALALPGVLAVYAGGLGQTPSGGIRALISGAPLQVGGDVILSSGGPVAITAIQPLRGGSSVTLSGRTVTTTGLIESAGPMSVEGLFGIDADRLTSGGTTSLDATGGPGPVTVADLLSSGLVTAAGASIGIRSLGGLAFDNVTASQGDASILTAGALTLANITAGDEIGLVSGGTFTLSGTARGVSIDVTSPDVVIGTGAALGVRGTTRDVTLRNGGTGGTFIGGEAEAGNYSLDRNEAARMFADQSITILAGSDITIGDLALNFGPGANIGTGGMLEISSPADITITGNVALRTSGADDTFRIDPRLIALRTDTGSISMFTGEGGGGTPQGRLELVGDRIVAATAANIAQLDTMTDLDAISLLLGQPGGTGEPLSAGTIHIDAANTLFIQNSGASDAFADRRGFAAGGFEIVTGSSTTQIAVNGRIITPAGDVTGLAVTPLVTINGAPAAAGGQFDARSTINGCVIGANCAPEPDLPHLDLPTREDIRSPVPDEGGGSLFASPLIELAATDPLITPPLVDEPITGVGNDDLWEPRCQPGEEDNPCPEEDRQP